MVFGPSVLAAVALLALGQPVFVHPCFKWPCWNFTGDLDFGMDTSNGKSRWEQHGLGLSPRFAILTVHLGLGAACLEHTCALQLPVTHQLCRFILGDAVGCEVMQGPSSHPPAPATVSPSPGARAVLASAACPADAFSWDSKSLYRKP